VPILTKLPMLYRILPLQRDLRFTLADLTSSPFFYQDLRRTFFVSPGQPTSKLRFASHYHPHTRTFASTLHRQGISGFLSLDTQSLSNDPTDITGNVFHTQYGPSTSVDTIYPREDVDFEYGGAYSPYNWELFFHAPLMIADRLSKEQRFADAQRWFHYIFNPTNDSGELPPQRYWRFRPFHDRTEMDRIESLLQVLADPNGDPTIKQSLQAQIKDWRDNPFEPHRIARIRLGAYQKNVVMKYIDNVIAWGDQLFARDTLESINEATQLYVLAYNLLGPRPERIPELTTAASKSYRDLQLQLDAFSDALVDIQNRFPFISVTSTGGTVGSPGTNILGLRRGLYFGIPRNEKLLGYWDTVEDRLFKIRHGLNLEGVERTLLLFEPPIEPGLLVRAAAAGVDLGSALSDVNAPLGRYRFNYLLPKALELCAEVKSLAGALLAGLEKRDAEALSNLRARQETGFLRLARQVREKQVDDAKVALEGLRKTRAVTEVRHAFYQNIEQQRRRARTS